jgi:hypothetical protein
MHVKVAAWFGMHPFSSQTSPIGHMPLLLRGTHVPPTQTLDALPQSFVTVHICTGTEQMPFMGSQLKPSRHWLFIMQDCTHLPATQLSPLSHCDWSKHWSAGAVHTPPLLGPAMQRYPEPRLAQSASVLHELAAFGWQVPSIAHV